jgi:hypothetical protein
MSRQNPETHHEPPPNDPPMAWMPWVMAVGALVISALVPIAFNGGTLWIVPIVVWPFGIAWLVADQVARRRQESGHGG